MKASLSLDLDNQWSYMKTHGDSGWSEYPSYLNVVVPRALSMLEAHGLRITFFIVGMDASLERNHEPLAAIAAAGHEIGNHSHYHEPWLHRRTEEDIEAEIMLAEESILAATGKLPRGFRGPGFVRSPEIYRVLARRGYAYDASTLPTFIGPLARAYYFRSAKLNPEEQRDRTDLFGNFSDGFEPNRPYRIVTEDGLIVQIPVTTMPGLRIPIHVSYLLYLARISPALAISYMRIAFTLCRLTRTPLSMLLHPLDFLGKDDCPALAFFPAMDIDSVVKIRLVDKVLRLMSREFEVHPLIDIASEAQVPVLSAQPE